MIRRSFRIGLTLGLLGGLAFALAKMFGARPDLLVDQAPATPEPWPPLQPDLVRPTPPPVPVAPVVEPVAPVAVVPEPIVDEPVVEVSPARPLVATTEPAPLDEPRGDAVAGRIAGTAAPTQRSAKKVAATKVAAKKATTKKTATSKKAAPAKKASAATKAGAAKKAAKKASKKAAAVVAWVEPTGDVCPTSHPVKAKLSSKIFHLPGMLNYARTSPDRCYRDAAAAEADEMRPAKR